MRPGNWTGRCKGTTSAGSWRAVSPTGPIWVSDGADLLEPTFKAALARALEAFHAETCHQLLVVTVPSLGGRSIEEFSRAFATKTGPGYPRFNNGLVLLIAPNERKARIEIGCGLEDVISDQQASEIMRQDLIPALASGAVTAGVNSTMKALTDLARHKVIPAPFRPVGCPKPP